MFSDVQPILEEKSDIGCAVHARMLAILHDLTRIVYLKVELAVIVDAGKQLAQTTYNHEGDGPLVLHCFDRFKAACHSI